MPSAHSEDPWRAPVRGGYPSPALGALTGVEQIRAFVDGRAPAPPIAELLGMLVTGASEGSVTFTMPASAWMLGPQGVVTGGVLAILADGPLGCAVQTGLPAATGYATSELSLRLLRPVRAGGTLTAHGRLVHAGRTLALSSIEISDERGRLLAHGSSLCFVRELGAAPPGPQPDAPPEGARATHPPAGPPLGEVVAPEDWQRMSGLEVLEAQLAGALPAPPLHHLTGVRLLEAGPGRATFAQQCHEWLCSPLGTVEGGVTAMLADCAIASAIQTTAPAGTAVAAIDLKVNYLRPVLPDGRDLVARARVRHRGRTICVAEAEVTNADQRPVALATGSAMLICAP